MARKIKTASIKKTGRKHGLHNGRNAQDEARKGEK